MYFKKLELLGFKSFAEKTILHFEPGITAVVGPNGCGKSNIFDAMRWVLGEQSVKSLRGSKMEDVIFNGTESIPALGYAEVSLTFSNETKALPLDYDEVTVTRRLFRSGESEYLINKAQVRLKDIVELFMGTGIGAESYSLIEQGKIDLILSSRPEDRRLVFDEAAGISKYKSQKKETIRRLEDTEANLLRINDIITEVKRQINSLERQAAKARRYKEVFEKLKELESSFAAYQLKFYQDELNTLHEQLNKLVTQDCEYTHLIEQINTESTNKERELNQIETNLNSLRQEDIKAENTIAHNSQQLTFNRERTEELQTRLGILRKQKEDLGLKISQDEYRLNNFKTVLDALAGELEEKKVQEAKQSIELEEVTKGISLTQHNVKEAKARVLEFAGLEASLNNQIQDLTNQLQQTIARKKRLDIEKFKAEEELTSTQKQLDDANTKADLAIKKFNEQKSQNEELKAAYSSNLLEKDKLNKDIVALENEKIALESQREFLSNLKLRYENITESSNAIVLLDALSDNQVSGMIVKIKEVTDAKNEDINVLSSAKHRARGVAKPISLDPQEIIKKIENLNSEIEVSKGNLNQKISYIEALSVRLSNSDKSLRECEIEYNNLYTQKNNTEQYYKKLKDESDIVLSEFKDTDHELNQLKEKEKAEIENLNKIKADASANQQSIENWLEEISSKNSLREKILINITQIKTEITAHQEKVSSSQETYRVYESALGEDKANHESCLQEDETSQKRIQELNESTIRLNEEIETAKKFNEQIDLQLNTILASQVNVKTNLKSLSEEINKHKNNLDVNKSKIHELEMRVQELNFSKNSIHERIIQVYKINPEELSSFFKTDLNAEGTSAEINTLKEKLDSYGQVNLVAIDEFDELKQRYDFLLAQHEDLIKSKESLHEAILKINRTTKKMFMETFEKLAVEFKNYFRLLFGGGDAQLFLIDEQDVLESGIEIVCRPPGKKLQNVLLLSGGEKAMSAIALLFAIFKVKPSPFCVLDEIDAALDEANVDRFSRMLVEFTSQSQFIVITHNKKTIANANIMYGITMEKAGISKIVSVKLAENNNTKETKEAGDNKESKEEPRALESV